MKKYGVVFAFYLEKKKQYGIIQVLGRGKLGGYNVRIFYHLIDNIDSKTIDSVIQTTDFYFINNFLPSDLIRTGKRLGRFVIPEFVSSPKYMRECERKPNGDLYWYVTEDMRVVKTFKKFDETLKPLSPEAAWGIQSIKKCWLDGFTLDNWHELEEKWHEDYLKAYKPNKFSDKKKASIMKRWKKTGKIPQNSLYEIELLLTNFEMQVLNCKDDTVSVDLAIKQLITTLNEWNLQYCLIETEEREELIEYIHSVLNIYHCSDVYDTIDLLRQW